MIRLRDIEGWDAEEVCDLLGVSHGNQRVLLHRARRRSANRPRTLPWHEVMSAEVLLRRRRATLPCLEFVELVTDYFERVLPAPERRAFEHHLTECDGCVSYLEQMRATKRLTGALRVDDVPADGFDELMTAFRAYQARRSVDL